MPIEFRCGNCHKLLRTADDTAGQLGKCPHCDAVMTIPVRPGAEQSGDAAATATPVHPADNAVAYGFDDRSGLRSHRGPMILSFGLTSTVFALSTAFGCICCPLIAMASTAGSVGLGASAIVLGRSDLKAMKAGEMDPGGRPLSTTGLALGIVGITLSLLGLLAIVAIYALQFGMMAATSSRKF